MKKLKKLTKKQRIILISISFLVLSIVGVIMFMLLTHEEKVESVKKETKVVEEEKKLQIVDLDSNSRPYAIMINNHDDARPYHSGLQDAYIVYEIIVEGGITRYMALYKDQNTERIHGLRSSRHYYLDYAMENDAVYVHWGWSPQATSDISKYDIDNLHVGNNSYAHYDYDLPVSSEHSTYTSMSELGDALAKSGYRTETEEDLLLDYSVDSLKLSDIANNIPANKVDIKYSSSSLSTFDYNPSTLTYNMSVDGKAHTDYITKEQYNFKNIITYQVRNSTISGDDKNRQNLHNTGEGTGYYISEGIAVPINWSKASRESRTIYTLEDGTELVVNDGNTYIAIQPSGQTLTIE